MFSRQGGSAYWDKGKTEISAFERQHSDSCCKSNWVCKNLDLQNLVFEYEGPSTTGGTSYACSSGVKSPPKKKRALSMPNAGVD